MNWLERIPRSYRGPIAVALVLAGGAYAVGWHNAWGLVVIWAGITLAFTTYLLDEAAGHRSVAEPPTPPDAPTS